MGKYGKRNTVSKNITDYNVAILGIAGIGKTTLMVNTCEKLVGDDGYIVFNMGKEDGISCIDGAIYENIESWKKFDEVTKDIVKNKSTDYPDLKIIVIDTIDQLFDIAEPEVIRRYNQEKMGEKGFKPATSINAAYGGFGAGLSACEKIVLDKIWDLKSVGIAVWMCGHTKTKDIIDPLTDQTYTTISANLSQRYFNAVKTKMHIVGMAVIDRDIVTESTGRKDIKNNEITKNKIMSEARKIIFRDDNYGVDSKSRFADIVEEIPLDSDAFIKAIQDAIYKAEKKKKESSSKEPEQPKPNFIEDLEKEDDEDDFGMNPPIEDDDDLVLATPDLDLDEDPEDVLTGKSDEDTRTDDELRDEIKKVNRAADSELKAKIKEVLKPHGKLADVDRSVLLEVMKLF